MADQNKKLKLQIQVDQTGTAQKSLKATGDEANKTRSAVDKLNEALKRSGSAVINSSLMSSQQTPSQANFSNAQLPGGNPHQRSNGMVGQGGGGTFGAQGTHYTPSLGGRIANTLTGGQYGHARALQQMGGGMGGGITGGYSLILQAFVQQIAKVMGQVSQATNVANNADITFAAKVRSLADQFIPLASEFHELVDAVDGTTERLRANWGKFQDIATAREARASIRPVEYEQARRLGEYSSQSRAISTIKRDAYRGGDYDRGTAIGETEYGIYQQRLGARDELTEAQRNKSAADQQLSIQNRNTERAGNTVNQAQVDVALKTKKAQDLIDKEDMTGSRNKAAIDDALRQKQQALNDLERARLQYQTEINNQAQAEVRAKEAGAAVARAQLNISRTELEIAKQREQRMTSTQQRLGSMGVGAVMQSKAAALLIQKQGIGSVTPDVIEAARGYAPEYIAKQTEKAGEAEAKEREKLGLGTGDYNAEGSLANVRKKIEGIQADVRVQIDIDAKKTADAIIAALTGPFKDVINQMTIKINELIEANRTGRRINNNQNN